MKARDLAALAGLSIREETPAPMPDGIRPPAHGDLPTGVRGALTLDSVYRAVQVIQTAASQLTLDAWRGQTQLAADDYPRVLRNPWEDADQTDLVTECVASLALRGNAYVRVIRAADNQVISLRPLHPLECVPTLNTRNGQRAVQWAGKTYGPRDILHMRLTRVPGDAYGLGPIQACQKTITGAQEMADYASAWITKGGVPTGVLSTEQRISQQEAAESVLRWNQTNSASDGVAVLGNGLKYVPLMLKPSEVQFLESREFDSKAIARMFGIPAHLMLIGVEGSSLTYQNIQDADLSFNRWTEMAYLRPIESGLSRILNGTQSVRFNLDAFLRPDTKTRYETYKVGIDAKFLTPEMVQAIEGIKTEETK